MAIGKLRVTLDDPVGSYDDDFGDAIVQSGPNLIVGASGTQNDATGNNGAAYIYTKGPSGWPTKPTVSLPSPQKCGPCYFGNSVSISGNTAIVGGYGEGDDMYIGTAYIYVKGPSGWPSTPTLRLRNPNQYFYSYFGYSVAVSGDTAVVGAMSSTGAGWAYIYSKTSSGWPSKPTVTLDDPSATSEDQFGYSVAVSGDTAIVGAPETTDTQQYAGKAYIYVRGASGWPDVPTKTLRDPDDVKYDQFGNAVAISGKTAIVGANAAHDQEGAAYIYVNGPSGWNGKPIATFSDPDATYGDHFGYCVALSGTVAVIGRPGIVSTGGEAYVFDEGSSGWPETPTVTLADPDGDSPADFGDAVATSGNDAITGASYTNNGAGVAYIFKAASRMYLEDLT